MNRNAVTGAAKTSKETDMQEQIVSITRLFIPLLAAVLTAAGLEVDVNTLWIVAGAVVFAASFVWAWWKNNNLTIAAQTAQETLDALKTAEKIECDRITEDRTGE